MPLITFDTHITERIRAAGQPILPFWIFLASYGMWVFAVFGVALVGSGRASVFSVLLPIALTHALTLGMQQIVRRERPPLAWSKIVMWQRTPSFPSAHASTAIACAMILGSAVFSLGLVGVILAFVLYVFAFGIALSRVMVGVHYVGDILGGTVFGTFVILLWYTWGISG